MCVVVLTFEFFARCEEFVEEKSPEADAARLDCFFVYFAVQILRVIGLRAVPAAKFNCSKFSSTSSRLRGIVNRFFGDGKGGYRNDQLCPVSFLPAWWD